MSEIRLKIQYSGFCSVLMYVVLYGPKWFDIYVLLRQDALAPVNSSSDILKPVFMHLHRGVHFHVNVLFTYLKCLLLKQR